MAQRTRRITSPGFAALSLALLLAGCAAPTRPLEVPASHPASTDAPETPVPAPSTTLLVPTQTGAK